MIPSIGQSELQVLACPKCGEMINTSIAQCAYCNAPVDPQWAAWASDAQATITRAFNDANNIMLSARGMAVLLVASCLPFGGIVVAIFFWSSIFVFPMLVLSWFWKYQWGLKGINKNHDDFKQSRMRILRASIIYGVTLIAWPIISIIMRILIGLLAAS